MAGHRCAHGPFRRTPNPQHRVYLCQSYLSCSFSLHSSPRIPFHRCSSCVPVPAPRALRMFPQASILRNLKVCGMEFKAGIRPVSRALRTSRGRFCRLVSEGEYGSSRNRRSVSGPTQSQQTPTAGPVPGISAGLGSWEKRKPHTQAMCSRADAPAHVSRSHDKDLPALPAHGDRWQGCARLTRADCSDSSPRWTSRAWSEDFRWSLIGRSDGRRKCGQRRRPDSNYTIPDVNERSRGRIQSYPTIWLSVPGPDYDMS